MPNTLTWKEKLEAAKEAGYDFVEISIDETDAKLARLDWTKEERLELVKTMYEVGLPIRSMCLSGHRKYPLGSSDPATEARSLEIMEKAIQLADDLGVRIIQLAGYDVYYDESTPETVERFGRNLKKAARMAARAGVLMGFETMETEFMNTCEKSMKYVDKINSTYLNVYPDCGNINNAAITYGTDVLADLRSCDGHVVAMHLKETVPGKFRDMMYGEGQVDFPAMIDTAWEHRRHPQLECAQTDYFNHAWGMQRNQSPYNGTIMHDGDTKGYQVSYRFHLTDPIHFKKHIQISMEHGHANHLSDDWACTAYWYQAAPVTAVTIQPVEERIPLKRTFDIPKPAHQVELTPEMQEAYRSRNERMEKFKVEKAEQIRLNAARTAPSEAGNKELAHKVKEEFDKEK